MKDIISIVAAATFTLSSQFVSAGEITDTYSAGDTLTAVKMNSIKAAVNDNNDFKDNQSTSGQCAAGSVVQSISSSGVVICTSDADSGGDITSVTAGNGLQGGGDEGAITIKPSKGAVSIPSSAFVSTSNGAYTCQISQSGDKAELYTPSSESHCQSRAPISLPDGATITQFLCA